MADQRMHIDDPHNTGVDEFPTALINAEETAREALAEKTDGTERVAIRLWLRPTLGAILLLACASGIAYKVISGYRHALPEAFVSVQDQNKWAAASAANNPGAPASAGAAAPPKSTAVAAQTAPLSAAPPAASAHDLDGAASGAAEAELSEQENPECAGIKTEQHEIDAALHKPYSPEQGRFMQRRLHELSEQLSQRKCSG